MPNSAVDLIPPNSGAVEVKENIEVETMDLQAGLKRLAAHCGSYNTDVRLFLLNIASMILYLRAEYPESSREAKLAYELSNLEYKVRYKEFTSEQEMDATLGEANDLLVAYFQEKL